MSKIFDWIADSFRDTVSNSLLTNTDVKLSRQELNCGIFTSTYNLTSSSLSISPKDVFTWLKGAGTLRITIGSTNIDIVIDSNIFYLHKEQIDLTDETTLTISVTSGTVYLARLVIYDENVMTAIEDSLQVELNNRLQTGEPLETKYWKALPDLREAGERYPTFTETFEHDLVGRSAREHIKGTGTYVVVDDLESESFKAYQCTSGGTEAIQCEQAYGEWEFDIDKMDTSSTVIDIISDTQGGNSNGYRFAISTAEYIILIRKDSGASTVLFRTPDNYTNTNRCYRIKVTRTLDGEFTMYIKGSEFGDTYQLVDVTGGAGTNPVTDNTYTTSKYMVMDLDAGDKIGNIQLFNQAEA